MTIEGFKEKCEKTLKSFPEHRSLYEKELKSVEIYYESGKDLYEELESKKETLSKRYVVPFLLGFTDKVESGERTFVQIKSGNGGG